MGASIVVGGARVGGVLQRRASRRVRRHQAGQAVPGLGLGGGLGGGGGGHLGVLRPPWPVAACCHARHGASRLPCQCVV